jgi:hypothetical protein
MPPRVRPAALALAVGLLLFAATPARADEAEPNDGPHTAGGQAVDAEPPAQRGSATPVGESKPPPEPVAEPEPPPRHTAIYGLLGVGAPVGFEGLEGVHRFGPLLEVAAGLGIGFSASGSEKDAPFGHATQWAVMPRLRVGGDHHVLTLGAGVSGGNYGGFHLFGIGCPEQGPCYYPTRYVFWGNVEIGGEHWWSGGFALRYFLGYARGCTTDSCSASGDRSFPYFGLGLGYAF